ncbi:MAG: peptidase M28, partial [Gemmatimonadota bacterium]|nr:peptidase M28 [Gemmatimonadota bacterium]
MKSRWSALLAWSALVAAPAGSLAQNFPTDDPVIRAIWEEGMERSHTYELAQALLDSIGPRLTGTPGQLAANEWAASMLQRWGVDARNEQYGTWLGWRRGISHIDLLEPRVRSLEGMMLGWSPGTNGKKVTGGVVILPDVGDSSGLEAWLPRAKGNFVLTTFAQPTCRPDDNWEEYATPLSFERVRAHRDSLRQMWRERVDRLGVPRAELARRLEDAGAVGV